MSIDPTDCANCGANPCYHLCFNSPHYYSPEQERADEPFYGDDDHRERYAAEMIGLDEPEFVCYICEDEHMVEAVDHPGIEVPCGCQA